MARDDTLRTAERARCEKNHVFALVSFLTLLRREAAQLNCLVRRLLVDFAHKAVGAGRSKTKSARGSEGGKKLKMAKLVVSLCRTVRSDLCRRRRKRRWTARCRQTTCARSRDRKSASSSSRSRCPRSSSSSDCRRATTERQWRKRLKSSLLNFFTDERHS
jgi:hypothetical protein